MIPVARTHGNLLSELHTPIAPLLTLNLVGKN